MPFPMRVVTPNASPSHTAERQRLRSQIQMTSPSNRRNRTRQRDEPPPSPTLQGAQPLPLPLQLSQHLRVRAQDAVASRNCVQSLQDQLRQITADRQAAMAAAQQRNQRSSRTGPIQNPQPRHTVHALRPIPPPALGVNPPPIQPLARVHYPGRQPSIELRQLPVHYAGKMETVCPKCSALHWMCEKLTASSITNPLFGSCCLSGKISLLPIQEPPRVLGQLLSASDETAKYFRANIRKFNNAFAFVSVGVKFDDTLMQGHGGPPVFKANGVCSHKMGALAPPRNGALGFAQIWIHDADEDAVDRRMQYASTDPRHRETWVSLQRMLREHNIFVPLFCQAWQMLEAAANSHPNSTQQDVQVCLRIDPNQDPRRYNLPTADQVSVILPDGAPEGVSKDLILKRKGDGYLQRLNDTHPTYQPLAYPLLFPYGELGWGLGMPHGDGLEPVEGEDTRHKTVTRNEYYAYRLYPRNGEATTLFRSGRLFQQYIVDSWALTEQARLEWLRRNQATIRADLYKGLTDALNQDTDRNAIGQRVVLPSSHVNSTRYMHQLFQDSMAICRYNGHPDLFITFTANPNWREIQEALLPGQTAADRPDIVARVFEMKKKALLDDLRKKGILGHCVASVWTVEFQKRGLPHIHLLIFFRREDKIRCVADFQHWIRADIPDPMLEPELHAIITTNMIHDCNANCTVDGQPCKKNFPKQFAEEASMAQNGYPTYARPNNGRSVEKRGKIFDNRHVVPYCPYLSLKYRAHINVEVCASVKSIKYIHKYIYKGQDRTTMLLSSGDEIKQYLDSRYIAPPEALYRLYRYHLHEELPSIYRLPIHLPDQQQVHFDPNEEAEELQERLERAQKTELTQYFKANADNLGGNARTFTYQEFPQHFTWDEKQKKWKIRQQGFAIGRIYAVSPNAGERFYLRLLLTQVRGSTSFADLQTVDGHRHPTFKAACLARGLLENDDEWRDCLLEAKLMLTGSALRSLFATILSHCSPTHPGQLWNEFREHICDDLEDRIGREFPGRLTVISPVEDSYDFGLYLIDKLLHPYDKTLADFPEMPSSQIDWEIERRAVNRYIAEQLNYNRAEQAQLYTTNLERMNGEQRAVFDQVTQSIDAAEGEQFFLQAPGGCGKSFVANSIAAYVRSKGKIMICVASSGIAATVLHGGRTAHSTFKIPIAIHERSKLSINKNSLKAELLKVADGIIWDEAFMAHRFCHETLDRALRDFRNVDKPNGGLTMLWMADCRQTLPVVVKGTRHDILACCLNHSPLWSHMTFLQLSINMRLGQSPQDRAFAQWLLDVGEGKNTTLEATLQLPNHTRAPTNTVESLCHTIYPNIGTVPLNTLESDEFFGNRAILCARNVEVIDINKGVLDSFPGQSRIYPSADVIRTEPGAEQELNTTYPVEFLNTLNGSGLPLAQLELKVGAPVMILRNLDPSNGLCNGTRGVILRMSNRVIQIRVISGNNKGHIAFIPRITIDSNEVDFPFKLQRRQFPLRLAFAMTINKSQGQSVHTVGLDLRYPSFTHGQLYVALSRCTSASRITAIFHPDSNDTCTQNVVFPEAIDILRRARLQAM